MTSRLKSKGFAAIVVIAGLLTGLALLSHNVRGQDTDKNQPVSVQPLNAQKQEEHYKADAAGQAIEGLELSAQLINADKKLFAPLEPVVVQLTLKNTSENAIGIGESLPELDYDFIVKGRRGDVMPATRYGHRRQPGEVFPGSGGQKTLQPGEEMQSELIMNRLADMTVEDIYTAKVRRPMFLAGKAGYVESNEVRVTVATVAPPNSGKLLPARGPEQDQ